MTDTTCYFISPLLNQSLHLTWTDAKQYCANMMPSKGTQLMSLTNYDDMVSHLPMYEIDPKIAFTRLCLSMK